MDVRIDEKDYKVENEVFFDDDNFIYLNYLISKLFLANIFKKCQYVGHFNKLLKYFYSFPVYHI